MNWKSVWAWVFLIWIVGIAAYSRTLSAPFVFDDLVEIVGNSALQDFDIGALTRRYPTRIVPYITLAANYAGSGEDTTSYHPVNIMIHLATATVIFFLARELTGLTGQRESRYFIAGACALLFVSHPIQTQAVTYIIQRLASLATLFYLLGLLLYVLARNSSTSLPPVRRAGRVKNWNWLHGAAWLALLLAMFSKEIAFTAPIAILMIEWFFFRQTGSSRVVSHSQAPTSLKLRGAGASVQASRQLFTREAYGGGAGMVSSASETSDTESKRALLAGQRDAASQVRSWRRVLPYLFLLLVIPLTLWFGRPPLVERESPLIENAVVQPGRPFTVETSSLTRREYALTQINVVRTYLRLLILPINQNLDYDYPISHSLFEVKTFTSLVLLLAVLGFGVWLFPRNRLASFGVFFFFLALTVESSFVPIRDVIFEHRLYLPSFGFFLAAAAGGAFVYQKAAKKAAVIGLAVVVIVALATLTYQRNQVWASAQSLWNDVVQKSPHKARGWNNAGVVAMAEGTGETAAEPLFREAIRLQPSYAEAYNNLGLLKARQGDYNAALSLFKRAVELEPLYVHAFNNLGVVYLQQGNVKEAIAALEMAVGTDNSYLDAKINLALAYAANNQHDKARQQAGDVLEREPTHEKAQQLLQELN